MCQKWVTDLCENTFDGIINDWISHYLEMEHDYVPIYMYTHMYVFKNLKNMIQISWLIILEILILQGIQNIDGFRIQIKNKIVRRIMGYFYDSVMGRDSPNLHSHP